MLDTPSPVPFDFLVNGSFLRTSLDEYMIQNGLSSETTINLQYVRSMIPPLFESSFEHDDWVSCVDILCAKSSAATLAKDADVSGHERILSGSYDGLLRVWNKSGQAIATSVGPQLGGHTAGIKSARFVSPSQIASSGLDRTVRIWKYKESADRLSAELKPTVELYGHTGSIDSISVHAPSSRVISASASGHIGLWSTSKSAAPAVDASLTNVGSAAKRRKLTAQTSTPQRGPLSMIDAHSAPATSVIFHPDDPSVAYT
jgi:ribosome biogenesis protein YTM1